MPFLPVLAWLAYFGVLQWSVVRFRVSIVLVLTLCTLGLGWWQWRRPGQAPALARPHHAAVALAGSAVLTLSVPLFSYLPRSAERTVAVGLASAAVLCAVLVLTGLRRRMLWVALASVSAYVGAAVASIRTDPSPRIDVWTILQQATDALARGENFYAMNWTDSPGVQDAFPYLPGTAVLLAPGRWLGGDVRWALLAWMLVAVAGLITLGRSPGQRWSGGRAGAGAAGGTGAAAAPVVALLLLVPGTLTQLDQSWTEPLLLAGLVWWAVLVRQDRAWWAVIPLALACASKQHLALLLPILLVWRPFGWRRTMATGALTGAFLTPWFLASPPDFLHDTVSLLVSFHPIRFANTLYLLALNEFGVTLPFWVTGLAVLGTLLAVGWTVRRRQPQLPELLRWLALLLLVANMVNKQAFYNQFWLTGALVAASLAVTPVPGRGVSRAGPATSGPARSATRGRDGWRSRPTATRSAAAG